jgi:polysaccharide biosynthesis protein PslG
MTARTIVRRQIRGFLLTWTAITLLVAMSTFFAIYLTYSGDAQAQTGDRSGPVSAASGNNQQPSVPAAASLPTGTIPPTFAPAATNTTAPTDEPAADAQTDSLAVAQAATEISEEDSEVVETGSAEGDTAAPQVAAQAAGPTPEPTTPPIEDRSFQVGIQVQTSPDGNIENQDIWTRDVTEKLQLPWIKQQVRWELVEPERGEFSWNTVGIGVRSARRFGRKLMVSVVTAPDWARQPNVDLSKHGPPADPQDYVNFITELLNRFGDDIHAIEIWNEQNLDREWMSTRGLNAAEYVELLRQSYQAIKAINPNIIVISGALSPGGGWTESDGRVSAVDDFSYLDGLIASGILNYTDCVGVHHNGYNIGPNVPWDQVPNDPNATFRGPFDNAHHSWSFYSTLQTYNTKVKSAGGNQPLCITEFGWATTEDLDGTPAGFGFADDNTLEEQAEWTVEALNSMEEWGFVWLAFIWNFNYAPQAGWDPANDNVPYSFIGPDWVHRPVYDAVAEWSTAR